MMKDSPQKSLLITVVVILTLTVVGCSSLDYSGSWKGTTADGKEISFTVQNNIIRKVSLSYSLECETGGFCPTEESIETEASTEITGDRFKGSASEVLFTGEFDSPTSVSGKLSRVKKGTPCGTCEADSSWTAKKQ